MNKEPEDVVFEAGTILHYKGLPFLADKQVVLKGLQSNKDLADREGPTSAPTSTTN